MFRRFSFRLVGHQPLLMHADDIWQADELDSWRKDPANKNQSRSGDDRSPAWTWQTYLYHDGETVVMPSSNIMVALRTAGTKIILKGKKTYKELTQSGLLIDSEYCKFFCNGKAVPMSKVVAMRDKSFSEQSKAVQKLGFSLFAKRARIGQSKHVRVRPRFNEWSVEGEIDVISEDIKDDVLVQIFDLAGNCGLCDWRPACKTPGPFGMFQSELKRVD